MKIRRGIIAAVLGCIVVASCIKRPPTALAPAEVMRRAVFQNQILDSVSFDMTALFRANRLPGTLSGSVSATGVFHSTERTWSADVRFDVSNLAPNAKERRSSGTFALSAPSPGSLFVLPRSIDSSFQVGGAEKALLGQWWRLTGGTGSLQAPSVSTPDPHVVEMYARILNVTGGGLERELGGRYVYHYRVKIGSGELLNLVGVPSGGVPDVAGDVWINPDSFVLERARWTIRRLPFEDGMIDSDLDIHLRDFNVAPSATLPEGSGALFPLDTILDIISVR